MEKGTNTTEKCKYQLKCRKQNVNYTVRDDKYNEGRKQERTEREYNNLENVCIM
jgi:hypothetical protein